MPKLILAGGGHAHLALLLSLAQNPQSTWQITLLTPSPLACYSGMVPGWLAGHYRLEACQIDLAPLCAMAGIALRLAKITALDATAQTLQLDDGETLNYDWLSLATGSVSDLDALAGCGVPLLAVKPIEDFVAHWPAHFAALLAKPAPQLAIVGGGAAGVELALAIAHAAAQRQSALRIDLCTGDGGLLAGHTPRAVRLAKARLAAAGVRCLAGRAVGETAGLRLSDGCLLAADLVLATPGVVPPPWLPASGLAGDAQGFVLVDAQHRSVSHSHVFAAGDVCARQDVRMPRAGVHAVRAGPVLRDNLLAIMADQPAPSRYRPRVHSLYLLACGQRFAILSWGPLALQGYWLWYLKRWIDTRFIARFSQNPSGHKT